MMKLLSLLLPLLLFQFVPAATWGQDQSRTGIREISFGELPQEARTTLQLIKNGGPFPYQRDGTVFNNFEKRLPIKKRGYYREYTCGGPG